MRLLFRWRLAAVLILTATAYAQTSRGTVTGTVLDPSGAAIGGARVTLTGVATGVRLSTGSNDTGVYRFDAVDPGAYSVKVTATGFKIASMRNVEVSASQVKSVDVRLELGQVTSTVEVSAASLVVAGPLSLSRSLSRKSTTGWKSWSSSS